MKTILLQKILFPKDENLQSYWGLFYHAPRLVMNTDYTELHLAPGTAVDFATYLNGFSIQKWLLYTDLQSVNLKIKVSGKGILNAVGYHLNPTMPDRHEFSSQEFDFPEPTEIELPFPLDTNEQLLSFEILPYNCTVLYGGAFWGSFEENAFRDVTLCLATTTCRKEAFIIKNVRLLKDELLCGQSEIRDHFFVHVVDNGRTLLPEEINGYHVTLHPNKNVGGSGGFARGMMESMHQNPEATHVLLMDDDVLVLPESIRRTYTLLTVLKEEWREAFISGAMLEMEAKFIQRENLAILSDQYLFKSVQPIVDQNLLENVLKTDLQVKNEKGVYAAWWYCCIPVSKIKENGLPLPLFVRGDDAEFGLRNKPRYVSMSGLCVWHMGFANKYNVSMDLYQVYRNVLIVASTTGGITTAAQVEKIKKTFFRQLCSFAYNGAELLCLALEDYMKGPAFIEQDNGELLLKEHAVFNEKLRPLSEFDFNVPLYTLFDNPPLFFWQWIIYSLTINFQVFIPSFLVRKTVGTIIYGGGDSPGRQWRCRKLLVVNQFNYTASLRIQDRKRCRKLLRRFKKDLLLFTLNHRKLDKSYAAARERFVSEQFWKEYLEI